MPATAIHEPQVDAAALYDALDAAKQGSWRELASQLAIPHSTFSRLRGGNAPESFGRVMQLVRFLDADVDDFLTGCGCEDCDDCGEATVTDLVVVGATDLTIADRDTAWDGPGASSRVFDFCTDEDGEVDVACMSQAFLWRTDDEDGTARAHYKLGYVDVIDGELQIVPRGAAAAAARIDQTDLPSEDERDRVAARLCSVYEAIQAEIDDWPDCPLSEDGATLGLLQGEPNVDGTVDPVPVEGPVVFEGMWTGDLRFFPLNVFTWESTVPVPIILDLVDGDHTGRTVGMVTAFERQVDGDTASIVATAGELSGSSDPDTQAAVRRAVELLTDGAVGVSIRWDFDPEDFDGLTPEDIDEMEWEEFEEMLSDASLRVRHVAIVDTAAFAGAKLSITGTLALAAASSVPALPAPHFGQWKAKGLQPLTVDLDGRVWGIVAPSGACHRSDLSGFKGCYLYPGEADSSLSQFHTKQAWLDDGRLVRVGTLTFEGLHAVRTGSRWGSVEEMQRHREDSTSVFALVRAWPTPYGLAVSGTVVDGLTRQQVMQAIGCGASVEMWRNRTVGVHLAPTEAWAVAASAGEGLAEGEVIEFTTGVKLEAGEGVEEAVADEANAEATFFTAGASSGSATDVRVEAIERSLSRIERALADLLIDRMAAAIPEPPALQVDDPEDGPEEEPAAGPDADEPAGEPSASGDDPDDGPETAEPEPDPEPDGGNHDEPGDPADVPADPPPVEEPATDA